jgi:hypothetical protein
MKVALDTRVIASMLNLPEGAEVIHVGGHHDPVRIEVIVAGPMFEEVPRNAESPLMWDVTYNADEGRLVYNWPTQEET